MIEQITANHFTHEGKTYFVKAEALKSYHRLKSIRNLLSRARLLDDTEASTVKPKLGRVVVLLVDGMPMAAVCDSNKSVKSLTIMLSQHHKEVKVLFRSEKTYKKAAESVVQTTKPTQVPKYFTAAYIDKEFTWE